MGWRTRQLVSFSIVYKGDFSFKQLYKVVRDWVLENGFGPDKWMETNYLQRDSMKDSEHWIFWRTKRDINKFFRHQLNIDFHTLGLGKKEIVHEGKKIKANSGEVEIFFDSKLILDPGKEWDKSWLFRQPWLIDKWRKRIFFPEIDKQEEKLIGDVYRLQNIIKQFLDLKVFIDEYGGETFHPKKGFE